MREAVSPAANPSSVAAVKLPLNVIRRATSESSRIAKMVRPRSKVWTMVR